MDLEGNGSDVSRGTILSFASRTEENLERQSVSRPGFEPNTHAERCHCTFVSVQDEPSTELLPKSVEKLVVAQLVRRHPV